MRTRFHRLIVLTVAAWIAIAGRVPARSAAAESLPDRLTDQEFWRLSGELSEPNGFFQSDNLVSNERALQAVVPALQRRKGHGAYLGVAPDQNFTLIAALEPRIAFIVDIRRGNLQAHLMYKALIERSSDRVDFYSRLFARKRPDGLGAMSTVQDIVQAFVNIPSSEALSRENLKVIDDDLLKTHGFPLDDEDLKGIEHIYGMFVQFGPAITYQSSNRGRFGVGNMPNYAELQMATDADGQNRSYLANEETFRFLKNFEARNLIVPVVGDFAGPKALRAVGQYLGAHGATVSAFYLSNVEQYLFQNGVWQSFYKNVAALPLDDSSVFIRSIGGAEAVDPIKIVVRDVTDGRIQSYVDLRERGRGR